MITLPVSAAEAILSALLNRSVTLDWIGDISPEKVPAKKRRGRPPGKVKKLANGTKLGKRKYTKRSKYWASKK